MQLNQTDHIISAVPNQAGREPRPGQSEESVALLNVQCNPTPTEGPRISTGAIFHTYSVYARGTENAVNTYNYLDLVPKGRDEDGLYFPMAWLRHHDRYDDGRLAAWQGAAQDAKTKRPSMAPLEQYLMDRAADTLRLAGGGSKGGVTIGETDDFSCNIVRDPVSVFDLNATILHCLGLDHTRLTYKFQGRYFRLTDVHGDVVKPALT